MLLCSEWQLPCPAPFQIQLLERRGQLLLEGRGHAVPSEHAWYLFHLQSWPLATWVYFPSETRSLLRAGTMNGSFMPALKYGPWDPAGARTRSRQRNIGRGMELALGQSGAGPEMWVQSVPLFFSFVREGGKIIYPSRL